MKTRWYFVVLSYAIIFLALIVFLFPIVWLFLGSFKPASEVLIVSLPTNPSLKSYEEVLSNFPVGLYLRNSLGLAVVSTVGSVALGSLAAYSLMRYKYLARQPILIVTLLMRMLPGIALGVPLFLLFSQIKLTNTFLGLVLAHAAIQLPLVIWIMLSFFEDLPPELEDAAFVDGCNRANVIYYVILPIATPGLAVASIFAFLISWNNFDLSLILATTPQLLTMPVGMSQLNLLYGVRWDLLSAAAVMYIVPTIVLALLLQRYIVRGLTMGAVKG